MAKVEHICLKCKYKFKHREVGEGGTLYCTHCDQAFLMQGGKIYFKKPANQYMISQSSFNMMSEGARKEIEEQGALEPPKASDVKKEAARLKKKGKAGFVCIYCNYIGGKISEMKQNSLTDVSGLLPADSKIVKCPQCSKRHITDGKKIYINQTKENGPLIDRIYDQIEAQE